jgi:hypothetical protein
VIEDPPLSAGAVHVRAMLVEPGVPLRFVGAPATVLGVALNVFDAVLVPIPLIAETLKSYELPFVRPVTVYVVPVEPVLTSVNVLPDVSLYETW